MKYLGYKTSVRNEPEQNDIINFKEPFSITRKDIRADYSTSNEHITQEISRIRLLYKKNANIKEIKENYIFPEVYKCFKNAVIN